MVQPLWKSPCKNLPKTNENICPHQDLSMTIYSSIIHNHPKLEITQVSIKKGMDKLIHLYNGKLLMNEKEGTDTTA